jgi:aminoglycoside phosphotransferase (APT) family kinase protein
LHAIDIAAAGLRDLGKPEGFLERQVHGWAERWRHARSSDSDKENEGADRVIQWLIDRLPPSPSPTIVHNDYKLDNIMFRLMPGDEAPSVVAVLDWEMATVGDPLADLGLTLCYWTWAPRAAEQITGIASVTSEPGWYTRDQFIERYARQTGRDTGNIRYYEVLGIFKLAVILQQIYYRYHRGQTRDPRFRNFGDQVVKLIGMAALLAE